jgi:hypothetical protein
MASTYSDLKIELIGTGEQVGTWGSTTNTNLGTAIEEAIVGSADVAFSSADVTLTLTNTNGTQAARHLRLNLTGTSGGARNLILGSGCQIDKPYIINNGLADTVTVKNTTGTGIAVPAGKTMWVFNNGTNVVEAMNHAASLTLGTALPVASGGTGASTLTANNVLLGNGTSAVGFVAPGTSGNVLTSNGTTWTSAQGFVTGMIMLWSGSVASVPSGWALCNGSNGTPDLRDRFVVGAGSTYAVGATGGSTTTTATGSISGTTGSTTLTTNQIPSHQHSSGDYRIFDAAAPEFGIATTNTITNPLARVTVTSTAFLTFTSNVGGGQGHTHTAGTLSFSGNAVTSLPPYYALAYIMKL